MRRSLTSRARRAAGMIEYVLLAGLAVVLYLLLSGPLQGVVSTLISNIQSAILS